MPCLLYTSLGLKSSAVIAMWPTSLFYFILMVSFFYGCLLYTSDDFSALQLEYPGGRTAHAVQSIGVETGRNAVVFGSEGSIWLPDYQMAQTMTVKPNGGEPYEVSIPWEVNGFEYQIREAARCAARGESASGRWTPQDSLTVLRLMDEIRRSWGMKFSYEA